MGEAEGEGARRLEDPCSPATGLDALSVALGVLSAVLAVLSAALEVAPSAALEAELSTALVALAALDALEEVDEGMAARTKTWAATDDGDLTNTFLRWKDSHSAAGCNGYVEVCGRCFRNATDSDRLRQLRLDGDPVGIAFC